MRGSLPFFFPFFFFFFLHFFILSVFPCFLFFLSFFVFFSFFIFCHFPPSSHKNLNFKARFWVREEERRTRRQNQVPFHNRTHRTFLLFACVETPPTILVIRRRNLVEEETRKRSASEIAVHVGRMACPWASRQPREKSPWGTRTALGLQERSRGRQRGRDGNEAIRR